MSKHHWKGIEPDPDNNYGFIYLIINKNNGMYYLGRKFYHRYRKYKPIGASNWKNYTGSCKPLNEEIKKKGKSKFEFIIVAQFQTRSGLMYAEANLQHRLEVLTELDQGGNRKWYNNNIGAIRFIPKEVVTEEIRKSLDEIIIAAESDT